MMTIVYLLTRSVGVFSGEPGITKPMLSVTRREGADVQMNSVAICRCLPGRQESEESLQGLDEDDIVLQGCFVVLALLANCTIVLGQPNTKYDVLDMRSAWYVAVDEPVKVVEAVLVEDEEAEVVVGEKVVPLTTHEG
jgi:hypothetical protein